MLGPTRSGAKLNELSLQRACQLKRPFSTSAAYAIAATLRYDGASLRKRASWPRQLSRWGEEHGFENY